MKHRAVVSLIVAAVAMVWADGAAAQERRGGAPAALERGSGALPQSLYRGEQPAVLAPQPEDDPRVVAQDTIDRFASLYAGQGRPRMAIFWNRGFSDRLSQWFSVRRKVVTATKETTGRDTRAQGGGGVNIQVGEGTTGPDAGAGERGDVDLREEARIVGEVQHLRTERHSTAMSGARLWQFQDDFLGPLMDAGVRVVDRDTVMRLTAADQRDQRDPNLQHVETDALRGYADMLVEVLLQGTSKGPVFRVAVKQIEDGRLVANVVSPRRDREDYDEEAEFGIGKYDATRWGFMEDEEAKRVLSKYAHKLAINVMESLIRSWSY